MTAFEKLAPTDPAQHLAALVDSSQDAIISKTLDGIVQSWNRAAERTFGYRAEEIIGKSILILIPPDRHHEETMILDKVRSGERIEHYETVRRRKDGTLVEVSITVSPIRDSSGVVVGASKIARDVTERRQTDSAAYHYAAIVESSQDAIVSKDLDGTIKSWNLAAQRLFGYEAREIIGRSVLTLIPVERRHEEDDIIGRVRRGERIEHFETVRQHKGGTLIDISLTVSPVKDANGTIIGASKVARDIRDKKRADEARELLLHEIKHRVKNTLGTVQAIVSQTFMTATPEDHQAFVARLNSLSEAHDLLTQENWRSAQAGVVAQRALKPFDDNGDRIEAVGPAIELNPSKALLLAMLLHELGTNAVKYGALSNETGRVTLQWESLSAPRRIRLIWKETGGPAVVMPARKGFGSRLIERSLQAEGGAAKMDFDPSGLVCQMEFAL